MLFNAAPFFGFFLLVFSLYWMIKSEGTRMQNLFLLLASYIFYGWWDWRFLLLMGLSSVFGFAAGLLIDYKDDIRQRKLVLGVCIAVNLLFLGYFKYYNFFADSLRELFLLIGWQADVFTLAIILPIGISFYTFHNISYALDVYRKEIKPTRDLIAYFAFISFFPQLVAGPIMKAKQFLPQFYTRRVFNYSKSVEGLHFILWGYFKKVVIADGCGVFVDEIFKTYTSQPSSILVLGIVYFAIQIYCDFSGYTDIAIGLGKLFGFEFTLNFRTPYFSRSIPEFWSRWHISLTSWFRDYVYIPLGGNRVGKWKLFRNIFFVFLLSGLWHGAQWTFVIWGLLFVLMYIPSVFFSHRKKETTDVAEGRSFPTLKELGQMILTFSIVCIAWVFFRSPSLADALSYFQAIVQHAVAPKNFYFFSPFQLMPLLFLFLCIEWVNRNRVCQLYLPFGRGIRWFCYAALVLIILFNANYHKASEFIYFQF